MKLNRNQQAFFELLKIGLWENGIDNVIHNLNGEIDWNDLYQLAQEQSVQGIVLQGLECSLEKGAVSKDFISQKLLLQWIGDVQMIEQQNLAMNKFIADLSKQLKIGKIEALLVKGQGVAQCYKCPQWRTAGDVDLLLDKEKYNKASDFLSTLASSEDDEVKDRLHKAYRIGQWEVELHGSLRGSILKKLDKGIDNIQKETFREKKYRIWENGDEAVILPAVDEDILYVFSHILQHFFDEGVGLRQICDWCRLLWKYKEKVDVPLLSYRLKEMGIMSEWKAFAALAIKYLGMPLEAMPLCSLSNCWSRKADRIMDFVLESGNFGHNRDYSYYEKYPYLVYKTISLWKHTSDVIRYFQIFPMDSMRVWSWMITTGVKVTMRGK